MRRVRTLELFRRVMLTRQIEVFGRRKHLSSEERCVHALITVMPAKGRDSML
jgi:hypothetical protein